MSLWGFFGLLLILAIMAGALYMSKLADNRVQDQQRRREHIRSIRTDIIDLDEVIRTLLIYDRQPGLLQALIDHTRTRINEGLQLLPDDEALKQDLDDLGRLQTQIDALFTEPAEPEIPASDRQIHLMKKHFARTVKLLKKLHADNLLTEWDFNEHRARLVKNSLMLEVHAYRQQAQQARSEGNLSSAGNFLKHAKELLLHTELSFAEKSDEIKSVSRAIAELYITVDEDSETKKSD